MASTALKRRNHLFLVKPVAVDPDPLDVSELLDSIEQTLRAANNHDESRQALSLLHSWAWNDMIVESCQERARSLISRFNPRH